MKNKYLYILAAAALFSATEAGAQKPRDTYRGTIRYGEPHATLNGNTMTIDASVDFSDAKLRDQQMVTLTPILRSGSAFYAFQPVVITGRTRDKALRRNLSLGNFRFETEPYAVVRNRNNETQNIAMSLQAPFQPWMRSAELVFAERVGGCAKCPDVRSEHIVGSNLLPPPFVPEYRLSYVTPPTEPVKRRSESYSAHLNFVVGKSDILRDFKDNAAVLDEVDRIVREVKNDSNLTITKISVTGYASPEGSAAGNMVLSEKRAKSFVAYLVDRDGVSANLIQADWKGDDWAGLRKEVAASDLPEKNKVLDILDNTSDVAKRKQQLKALGPVYRTLLDNYYPPLRRNDYTIDYVARPFNVDEAKELIKTKPQYLSLNEMFLVAESYPRQSQEFKDVFDVAVRLYPDNAVASLNAGALDIERGALDTGIARLQGIDMPEAWNDLGVAYILKGEFQKAAEYFRKAAAAGDPTGAYNAGQFDQWEKNK